MCVCVCDIDAKGTSHTLPRLRSKAPASGLEQSRNSRISDNPEDEQKKAPPKAEQKTINAQRSCEASHSRFTAIKVPTGKLCGYAAELAHAQTEQPK